MLVVALSVVWCIWTARVRCEFWWFEPDPSQVEHEEDEGDEGDEGDERNSNASLVSVPQSWTLRWFITSLSKLLKFKSVPGESHAMQDTSPRVQVDHDTPSSIGEPNFWANPYAA